MQNPILTLCSLLTVAASIGSAQTVVRVEPSELQGPRALSELTEKAAIRDYLQSWQSLKLALEQNRSDLLDPAFVGTAKDKLTETVQQQTALGILTRYQDTSHDIKIVFYSPEGLSIELADQVEYDVQVLDHDKVKTTQHVTARYVIILTPAEVRWRVRVFQAEPK
jgi:hypothetical protein